MRKFDQINVIPFIDIMLVLLAIVLTTATFIAQGKIEVELPEAESGTPVKQKPAQEIVVAADERLYYEEEVIELQALDATLGSLDPDQPLVLRVDATVPFARFVEVVDLLKQHSLENLSIMTRKPAS